jgi:hypothetical protein
MDAKNKKEELEKKIGLIKTILAIIQKILDLFKQQ